MINNVTLIGRITRELELRSTASGVSYVQFTLAVGRNFKNKNGERDTDFISCRAWRQNAEFLSNYAGKGMLIGITGRIETGSYDNEQGQRVYTTDVVCDNVQILDSRNTAQQGQPAFGNDAGFGGAPFGGQSSASSSTFTDNNQGMSSQAFAPNATQNDPLNQGIQDDISDNDLPF